jgi:hypothetical protein
MAYDEYTAQRIRTQLIEKKVLFSERNMMGGRIFFVDDKMLCGIHIDKKYGDQLLMARIGEEAYKTEISKEVCLPMDFTGRPMRGYAFIIPEGIDKEEDLSYWLDICLAFNPFAKANPRKKKPKKK